MSDISIRKVSGKRDLMTFIKFPWKVYREHPQWVPPLIMDQKTALTPGKHPFYDHSRIEHFFAERNGKAVGRISAVVDDNFVEFQGEKTGFFGFFECLEDQHAASALVEACRNWLRKEGMSRMMGPTAPSTNDTMGVLMDSYEDPPMVKMSYNPPYYSKLLLQAGLTKEKDLYAYNIDYDKYDRVRFERIIDIVKKRHNITFRTVEIKQLASEVEIIKGIYNDAWEKNWGFVPWTDDEMQHLGKDLKPIAEVELTFIAYKGSEPVAFSITLPDVYQALISVKNGRLLPFGILKLMKNQKKIDRLRVLAFGVKKEYRNLGLDGLLIHESYKAAEKLGYVSHYECSWILEDNLPMRRILERMGAYINKTYRVYGDAL